MDTENMKTTVYDEKNGLTSRQVAERFDRGDYNEAVDSSTRTYSEIIKNNVFTYFNLIFAVLAALLCIVGSFRDLTFLGVIFFNTIIGIIQEIRSKAALDKLKILSEPKASVIRDGSLMSVPIENLVIDDLVEFSAGNQIPADAVVVSGTAQFNEALITGESEEVEKTVGDELLSGSFVVSGKCRARLTRVGRNSYVSKLTLEATEDKREEQSELIRSLDKLVKIVGVIIIPIGLVLFIQQMFFTDAGFRESVTGMVAAVIGMIPEGLYLLASVAMVVSIMRLARQKVLVRNMKCIETLARVDVLCVDKTGTITDTTMKVERLVCVDGSDHDCVNTLLSNIAAAMENDNITMQAIKEYFVSSTGAKVDKVVPFSSQFKYSGAVMGGQSYVLGAPEFVLREKFKNYENLVNDFGQDGFRVLVFAKYSGEVDGKQLTEEAKPLGFILLANPIRETAKETFEYFARQGVEIKVISGDNPVTVSRVAGEAGIKNAERYVDASTLLTDEDISRAAEIYNVFGRVVPEQKRKIVCALKDKGYTVGMTGDGVNDVLALKEANCSIAMASGSEAASQVSQLVLVDSDFSKMPSVVDEGRRVVNNIERSASLFLVKNIFSLLLAIFSMAAVNAYPMKPSQISLIAMFTIGIPAFFLSLEPNKSLIKGRFLTNVFSKSAPAGITDFLIVSGLVIFCNVFDVEEQCVSTACTILVSIVGFMILYRIMKPMTVWHSILYIALIGGWLFCALFMSWLFAITEMNAQCVMLLVVFALAADPLLRYLSLIAEQSFWRSKLDKISSIIHRNKE